MCLCHLTWHREIKAANQLALDREIMPDYAAGPNAVTGVLKVTGETKQSVREMQL